MNQELIQSLKTKIQELESKLEGVVENGGIKIIFSGKANAQRIVRKVKPRTLHEIPELSISKQERERERERERAI